MWARKGVLEMGDLEVLVGRDSLPHPFPPSLDVTCSLGHIHHNRTAGYPFLSVGRTLEQKHEFELSIPSFLFLLSLLSCSAFFLPARGFPTSCYSFLLHLPSPHILITFIINILISPPMSASLPLPPCIPESRFSAGLQSHSTSLFHLRLLC